MGEHKPTGFFVRQGYTEADGRVKLVLLQDPPLARHPSLGAERRIGRGARNRLASDRSWRGWQHTQGGPALERPVPLLLGCRRRRGASGPGRGPASLATPAGQHRNPPEPVARWNPRPWS